MEYSELANKYFKTKKNIYESIEKFSEKKGVDFFSKLKKDRNEINFMSWLTEMKFGLKLDEAFQDISYNSNINGKTPDWIVRSDDQYLIFEVVRINPNEKVFLDKIDEFKNPEKVDADIIGALRMSSSLDGLFFYGKLDKLLEKEIKYREIVEKNKYPFIICIDCSEIELFIFYRDFYDFFVGQGDSGYFKTNRSFGKNVSAILMQVPFDGFRIIVNENCENGLSECNLKAIECICTK